MNPPIVATERPPTPVRAAVMTMLVGVGGSAAAAAIFVWLIYTMRQHRLAAGLMLTVAFAYGLVILGIAFAAANVAQRFGRRTLTAAAQRYRQRMMVAMTAYIFTLMLSLALDVVGHPAPWLAWVLALAPPIPIVAIIVVMGLYLREETDELERTIVSEAALWATGGLLAIATTWGFLEQFGLVIHIEAWAVFPIWAICLAPANAIVRRRYQ